MKNKFTTLVLAFIAGAIIGAFILWLICGTCCKKSCCREKCSMIPDTTAIHHIGVKKANTLFKAYLANTPFVTDTLRAFTINMQQFDAMKLIAYRDSSVHGFRIYMGLDSLTPVRMVVGTGSPDKTDQIYQTTDACSGPCPHICDESSPIMEK